VQLVLPAGQMYPYRSMKGATNAFAASLLLNVFGTINRPSVPRFARSSCVPSAVFTVASEMMSDVPPPGLL